MSLVSDLIREALDPGDLPREAARSCEERGVKLALKAVDGDPKLNKGLLGYLMNGQTRLLAVVDKKGLIVARCMIRLLMDEQKNPVLFMEKLYGDANYKESIEEFARAKAKDMGLPLMTGSIMNSNMRLKSLGGLAPYEYSDGAAGVIGVQVDSEYTLIAQPMKERR
jgi:hypothetical protein